MKVLMFGWEFPPYSSGGLGTACYGLTKSLSKLHIDITFILPYGRDVAEYDFLHLRPINSIKIKTIKSMLTPYMSSQSYSDEIRKNKRSAAKLAVIYSDSLFDEVYRYSEEAKLIAMEEDFDIIHCHDWMTFKAGINAKIARNRPLVVHVHSTEFDRTGGDHVNQYVYDIEREGMEAADAVIAVSNFTKNKIIKHYGINPDKVYVVHNAVDFSGEGDDSGFRISKYNKMVLFLGRITLQKGPDYFLYAAKRVLQRDPNVKFIIVGKGDMERFIIEKTAELGISKSVTFAGFLQGRDIDRIYKMADLYVMPSVSEPFGIAALEAMRNGTPLLVSKQSGVSEVVKHCLTADFWDVDELANKILSALKYKALHETLKEHGSVEVKKFSWDVPAQKCIEIYNRFVSVLQH
ncbi:MAG: glycosyltransferase family 4 protein [Nanoarchaeota archaeon]